MPDERTPTYEELSALVVEQAEIIRAQAEVIEQLRAQVGDLDRLRSRVGELERQLGQNSGNSGKPPSRDSAAERQRQAEERKQKAQAAGAASGGGGSSVAPRARRWRCQTRPTRSSSTTPEQCSGCGSALEESADRGFRRRQVVEVPPVKPVVVEHRAHTYLCECGFETTASFPTQARAPVSYGPRARAIVAYLLARQHIPNRRVVEAMRGPVRSRHLHGCRRLGLRRAPRRRLGGFIAALVTGLLQLAGAARG